MFKATGDFFNLKLYVYIRIFTNFFLCLKRLFLIELFLEEAHFNAYL